MKNIVKILLLFVLIGCDNDESGIALPSATQTGEDTFGCLIDGKIFVDNTGMINCFYQVIDGEFYFGIQGKNESQNPSAVNLGTYNLAIEENQLYTLTQPNDSNAWAEIFIEFSNSNGGALSTTSVYTGEMKITRLDMSSNIVSGTFWFDVQHPITGETIEIRDGRFDHHFSE